MAIPGRTRLDGIYRQTRATVLSEYAYHPVRFFSIFFALVIGLGVLAFFGPISAQIDNAVNPDNTSQIKIVETTDIDSQFLSVAEVTARSSQPNEYFEGNYEVVPAEDTIKLEKSDTNISQTEVKLIKEVSAEDRTKDVSVLANNDALTIESKDQGLTAGAYKVETIQKDTGKVLNDQKVLWGVLAFNPDYAVYPVGKDAFFSLAVLDDRGKMVCTAAMTVEVTAPDGKITTLSTADGTVRVNKDCEVYGKTDKPDYEANYQPKAEGEYKVKIIAKAGEGTRTLHDQFSVKANQDFYLQRVGATRTYPPVDYNYTLNFEASKAGSYVLDEFVPSNFEIKDTEAQLTKTADSPTKLSWKVDAKAGQIYPLTYTFKTPNISPFLFELGPAEVKPVADSQLPEAASWLEPRSWLIASDNACQSLATGNWSATGSWQNCGGTVPQAADTVQILNTHNITEDTASVTVAGVTIDNGGTLTVSTTNAITVSGNWSNSGTFTAGSGRVTFSSTATGKTLAGTMTGATGKFYNLTFNGVAGGWTFSAAVEVANDFNGTNGAITAGNQNLTVTQDFILANTAGVSYTAGSSTLNIARHFTDSGNKFVYGTSTVSMTGTGTVTIGNSDAFYNLNIGYTSFTTTLSNNNWNTYGQLSFNGGSVSGSSSYMNARCSTSCTPIVFNSATTLTGNFWIYLSTYANSVTTTIAGGNYGTWNLVPFVTSTYTNSTYNLAGDVTSTASVYLEAAVGSSTNIFNTQNFALTASRLSIGEESRTASWTINLGSSTLSLTNTSDSFRVASNGGSHTLNMSTSATTVYGNLLLANGTGTITTTPGTSTVTFAAVATGKTITSNAQSFYNIVFNGVGGGWTFQDATIATNDFTVTNGAVTANNLALTITRDFTLANTAGVSYTAGSSTITVSRHWNDTGTKFVYGTSTVVMNGTGTQTGSNSYYNFSVGYSGLVTTISNNVLNIFGVMTVNGGTVTASGSYYSLKTSITNTPFVFASPTTLNGSLAALSFENSVGSITTTVAGGNYGNWPLFLQQFGTAATGIFQLGGNITSTSSMRIDAADVSTGVTFTTTASNYSINLCCAALILGYGSSGRSSPVTANLNGSSVTVTDLKVDSNSGSHILNMNTSSISANGDILFSNGTGSVTVNPGTSTFTMAPPVATTRTYAPNSQSLYNLTVNGAGTVTPSGAVIITNDLTMTAGTLNGTQNVTVKGHVAGTAGIITLTGGTFKHMVASNKNFGTTSGSTAWTFSNLTFTTCIGICNPTVTVTTQTGGTGGITITGVLTVGDVGDSSITELNAGNRTWTLSGTAGDPFQLTASPAAVLTPATSTFKYSGNNGAGNTTVQSTTYNNLEINDGLQGYWKLDETTTTAGATVMDVSGNAYAGTPNGAGGANNLPQPSTDVPSVNYYGGSGSDPRSLAFDGTDDYVNAPAPSALSGASVFSISIWAKSPAYATNPVGISLRIGTGDANNLFILYPYDTVGGNGARVFFNGTSIIDINGSSLDSTVFNHFVYVQRSATDRELYINGASVATNATSKTLPAVTNLTLGSWDGTTQFLNGSLDDARVYNRALGTGEISSLYAGNHPTYETYVLEAATTVTGNLGVRTGSLDVTASNYALTVGGNLTNVSNFAPNSGTVTMNSTATGKTIQSDPAFYNITYDGVAGAWTYQNRQLATNDFTVTNGAVTANNLALTVTRDFTLANTAGVAYTAGSSTVTISRHFNDTGSKYVYGTSTVSMTGTGTLSHGGNFYFYNLNIGYTTFTTTLTTSSMVITNQLTFNGGTVAGGGNYFSVLCSTSCTRIVFNSPTSLTGSKNIYFNSNASAVTQTIAAGNYGSWGLIMFVSSGSSTSATYNLAGNVTTTGLMFLESTVGATGTVFNTQNFSLTTGQFSIGEESRTASWTINLGSSAISFTNTGDNFRVASNGGSHTLNMSTSTWTVYGNLLLANGTGTITTSPGTSTVTFAAVGTGKTITFNGQHLYNLVFNGVGGGWTYNDAALVDNDFTVTNGAVTANNLALTVTRDFTLANTAGVSYTAGSSTVTVSRHFTDAGTKLANGTSTITLSGTGTVTKGGSFYNLSVGYPTFTTTFGASSFSITNTLTFNGGTVAGGGLWNNLTCSGTCTPVVFASPTTLNGGNTLFFRNDSAGTKTIAGGNYGSWVLTANAVTGNSSVYNLGGAVTTTSSLTVYAATGLTGTAFNTQNYGITASSFAVGTASSGAVAVALGSSTLTLSSASDGFYVVSNGGSHTIDMGSANIDVKGSVKFVNGTGTIAVTPGTSTLTWTNTSGAMTYAPNGQSLYNMTLNGAVGSGSVTPSTAVIVTNDLTMTAGTLSGTQNVTVNGNVAGTAGIISLTGGTFEQRVGAAKNFGTTSGSTAWTFYDLTFSNSHASSPFTITTQTGGSGGITVSDVLRVGKSGDAAGATTTLNAGNRTWTLSGTGGDPFQILASPLGALTGSTSKFYYTGANAGGNTTVQSTSGSYYDLELNAADTFVLEANTTITNNLTITHASAILDVTAAPYALTIGGNYSNSGTFTARTGTVTLNGSATQTLSGTMTTTSAFYNLTLTNSSGTSPSDNERTGWVAGIDFNAAATVTNNYVITTANVRVEYNSGSTYTIANINWNGAAIGTRIYFRNSAITGTWLLNVSGTQTAVSYVNVSRSDASSGSAIVASNGTNFNAQNNTNWTFSGTVTGTVYGTDETTAVATGPTVRMYINGTTTETTTANGSGGFTFTTGTNANDVLSIYLDTAGGITGLTVTKATGSGLSNIHIYQDRLTTRCDNTCSLTNANIDSWDKGNDTDIHATVTTSNLVVDNDWKLKVANNTFAPGGTITTSPAGGSSYQGQVGIDASAVLDMAGSALSIGGNYSNSGTFTSGSNTTTFTDTATGNTLAGTITGASSFYNLVFDGVAGGWTYSNAVAATNDFTVTNGAVTANNLALTVTRDFTLANTAGVSYTAGSSTVTVSRHWADAGNKFAYGTSTVVANGTGNFTTGGGANFYNLSIGYTGFTTTLVNASSLVIQNGALTFNGGAVDGTGQTYIDLNRSSSGSSVVFASATTITGSPQLAFINNSASITNTIAGGNYGSWQLFFSARSSGNSSIYQLGGDITATAYVNFHSFSGMTGVVFNTQNYAINSTGFSIGRDGQTGQATANLGSSTLTLTSTSDGLFVVSNSGTSNALNMNTASISTLGNVKFLNGTGTVTVNPGTSTVNMTATGTGKTITSNGQSFYNLVFNGVGGGWTFQDATIATNDFTVTNGAVTANNLALTVTRDFTLANTAGVAYTAGSSTVTVSRHFSDVGTKFASGTSTVAMIGTGTFTAGSVYNLSIGYSSYVTTLGAQQFGVTNILTLNGGTATGGGYWTNLTCSGTCTPVVFASPTTLNGTNTLYFRNDSAGTKTIAGGNYGSWTVIGNAVTGNSSVYNLGGDLTTTSSFNIYAGSALTGTTFNTQNYAITALRYNIGNASNTGATANNLGSSTLTLSSTADGLSVVSNGGSHTLVMGSSLTTVAGNVLFVNGTGTIAVTPGTSTLTWNNTSGTKTYAPNGQSLYNMTLNGSGGTVTPSGAVIVTNDLTMTAGTLNGTQNVTVNGNVAGTAGIISLTGGTFEQRVGAAKNFGTTSGSTAWTFYDLTFSNSHASSPFTVTTQTGGSGGITVSDVLKVGKSGDAAGATTTLNAGNRIWTLSGTAGDPFQLLASPLGVLTGATSTFKYTGNNAGGNTTIQSTSGSYNNLEINDGLQGYWKLDETTTTAGATVMDVSGNAYAGTPNGAGGANNLPQPSTDVPSVDYYGGTGSDPRSLNFDGTDDYVSLGTVFTSMPTAVTKSVWLKKSTQSGWNTILDMGSAPNAIYLENYSNNPNVLAGAYVGTGGNAFSGQTNEISIAVTDNVWTNIVQIVTTSTMSVYKNGSLVSSLGGTYDLTKAQNTVNIGGLSRTYLSGYIDDVRIYNRALGTGEITSLAAGNHPTYETYVLEADTVVTGNLGVRTGSLDVTASNYALTVGGNLTNVSNFAPNSGTVTMNSTASGKTIQSDPAFYKLKFHNASGGGGWTSQNRLLVDTTSGTPAADALVIGNGTVTIGDGNADNLLVYGGIDIAVNANETGTLQTKDGLAEGSTITIQVNKDTATQCANCIVDVGASSGSGQGTLTINENGILKLIPKSSATASDTGVEVASTGKLNVTGALSLAETTSTAITDYDIRETKTCAASVFTGSQFNGNHVRTTSGLAVGQIYPITATTVNDAQCDTGTHDSITRADTSTASVVSASKTLSNNNGIMSVCLPDTITANDQKLGSYMRDFTGTKGYFQIVDSANDSASCTGTDDLLKVIESPDVFSGFTSGDTVDISDGVRPGDNFEIYDYAHVTAEDGVACTATNDQAGEAYIRANAGSETVMNYADVCDLGRNTTNKYGVTFNTVNGTNANEGVTIDRSRLRNGYMGAYLNASSNNNTANSKGITNSSATTNTTYGFFLESSANSNTFTSNVANSNSSYGFYLYSSSSNTLTSNVANNNTTIGFYIYFLANNNTLTSNTANGNANTGIYLSSVYNNTLTSNTVNGNTNLGFYIWSSANTSVISNTVSGNTNYGIYFQGSVNNTIISNTATGSGITGFVMTFNSDGILSSNTATGNTSYGLYLDTSANITLTGNQSGGQAYGLYLNGAVSGVSVVNDVYGTASNTTADIGFAGGGTPDLRLYNTTLSSSTEVTGVTVAGAYIISRKHDTSAGTTKIWGEYAIPSDTAETPQVESTNKFNYANNLWEKSVTAHRYLGTGTEDTNLSYDLSAPADLSAGPYSYRLVTKTAGVGASCVTSQAVMDVYRNGTDVGDLTTGTLFTDSTGAVNTKFTVDCGATPYALNATYSFVAYDADNSTSVIKPMTMMQDGDIFTVGSGKTLEMKGQTTATNLSTVTRGATGGYHFNVAGTIDAQYYKFSYLGGTSGGTGLDLQSGATLTNLDDGQFDNYQNVGATDTYITVHGSLIGTGAPAKTWDNMTFLEASDAVPEYSVTQTATGAPAAGNYWSFFGSTCTGWTDCEASDLDTGDGGSDTYGFLHFSSNISIQGIVYLTNESTIATSGNGGPCDGSTAVITARVDGGSAATATCSASTAAYTVYLAITPTAGQTVTVYLTSASKGNTVTLSDGATDTGVDIYIDHVAVRHEVAGYITNVGLDQYDNDDNATDMLYTSTYNGIMFDVTVEAGVELHVSSGKEYRPSGTVTTGLGGDVHNAGTLEMGGNALSIGGSYNNAGTFNSTSNTTTFTSTATGKTLAGTMTGASSFYNLVFDGVAGGWTYSNAVAATNDFTVTNGAVTANNLALTVTRDFTLANTVGVAYTAGSSTITVSRHWTDNGYKFVYGTSTVALNGTGTMTVSNSNNFYNLSIGYTTFTTTFSANNFQVRGQLIFNGGTVTGGTYLNTRCSVSCTPIVFNSATTLSNGVSIFITTDTNSVTTTIAGGNYGTWNLYPLVNSTYTNSTYNLAGDISMTGNFYPDAAVGSSGNILNTQNYSLTAGLFSIGEQSRTASWTINLGSSVLSFTATGDSFRVASNGGSHTLNMSTSTTTVYGNLLLANGTGSITTSPGTSTVTFAAVGTGKTITSNGQSFYNLVFNGVGGGWTIQDAMSATNNFSITNGTFDTKSGSNYALTIGGNFTGNTGTWTFEMRASTITVSGNWDTSAIATDNVSLSYGTSTVVMDGTGTKTIKTGATNTYNARFWNLNAGQAGGKTTQMLESFGVDNVFTLGAGTFDLNSKTFFMVSSPTNPLTLSGTFGTGNGSLYFHGGTASVNLLAYTYNSSLDNALPSTYSLIFQGTTTITGNMNIGSCCNRANITNLNGQTVTVNGSVIWNIVEGILTMGTATLNVGGSWTNAVAGTFNANTSTVNFTSTTSGKTITSGGRSFYNLTFNGSGGVWTPQDALVATNDLTMTAGTLNGTQNVTVNGNVAGTAGIISLTGGTFEQRVGAAKNFGTTSGSTAWTFYDLTFSNSHASSPFTVTTQTGGSGGITVSDILKVGKSGDAAGATTTLNAGNRTWTLSGTGGDPFQILASPLGALVGGTSKFYYTGANAGGNTTIQSTSGSYYDLELNAADTFVLEADTVVTNNLTITHASAILDVTAAPYALTIGGNYSNSGTFTARTGSVTFNATDSGNTLSGTLNGTSAFYKVIFNGVAGAWTIQNPMLVDTSSGTPAADTLVVSNGTVTIGNGDADNLLVYGGIDIATTADQTAVLQTMDGLAEGSTITLQVNKDTSTQCTNCIVDVGASSGSGQGTLTINENGILKLIPKSSATASDTGVEVASTGKLNVTGAISLAETTSTAITDYDNRETKLCANAVFTASQFTSKHVRTTSGLAIGQIYPITATTVNDAQCDTGTHDSITRADTSTASVVSASKTLSNNNGIMAVCIPDSITADNQKIGSYMRDFTGTKGYFQITDSANDDASCTGTNDLLKVIESPDVFSGFTSGDTVDISDGVRPGDNFEIYDYANVTAEDGVACTAVNDEAGESYIRANAGSETVMNYADVCDLGRNTSNKDGIRFNTVNGTNASEGVTIDRSRLRNGYIGAYLNASPNNNTANSKGVTNSSITGNSSIGIDFQSGANSNTFTSNSITANTGNGFYLASSNSNTFTSNTLIGNTGYGFRFNSDNANNTLTSNIATGNANYGFYLLSTSVNNTLTSNSAIGNASGGFLLQTNANNNTLTSNSALGNNNYGFNINNVTNNTFTSNTVTGNSTYGFALTTSASRNTLISNTATGNGTYGILIYGVSNNTFIGNQLGGQQYGLSVDDVSATGNVVINDVYGTAPNTSADIRFAGAGAHTLSLYNTTLSSTTEVSGVTVAGAYIVSRKHDTSAGTTKIWGEYAIPADTTETPQVESTDKFNYANNLWEKSVTAHGYSGTGTEDTNLSYDLTAPADLSGGPYAYKLVTKTAGVGASCVTSQAVMDVYRNGTDVGDLTTGTLFTDSTGAVNTKFTVDCGATPYALNATYTFSAFDADNSTSTIKPMTMMQDGDIFTVGSGKTLEMKGQTTATNLSTVTRGATGGYHFDVAGTIDAQYYKFSYLGGTSGGNGLDLQSGATLTNLDDGQFDNFQNVGATDTYMKVHGSLIGTGAPAKTWDNMTFLEASDNVPEYSVTQTVTGAPAAGNYWVLYPSTCTGWASCEASDSDTGDGGSDNLGFLHWQVNTAPNDPSALAQKKTDDTVLAVGDWTNETSVKFTATADDTDNPDTLYLCVEKDLIADAFSNTEDSCGSGVAYSGSPVTVIVTIAGITDASEYHWQARVKDTIGDYSGWISFGANPEANRDFGVDTTACTYGSSVYDGTVEDVDASYNDGSLTSASANWDAFTCTVSGLNKYQYSIGTTAGGTDIKTWTDNSTTESVTSTSLILRTNQNYFFNVRAVDNATNTSGVTSSNGQSVLPTISLSLGATTITFANLNNGNNRSDSKTLVLTSSTNAYGGYVIRQYASSLLTKGIKTIPMFEGGSYASPGAWPGGTCTPSTNCGYGYTSDDTTIQGVNIFGTGTLYAPLSLTAFGDIIADHTTAVDGTSGPVTNEAFTITHKVSVGELQEANPYTTEVLYILTGTF